MKLDKQSRNLCITSIIVTVVGVKRYWQLESSLFEKGQTTRKYRKRLPHPTPDQCRFQSSSPDTCMLHIACCLLYIIYSILYILYCIFYIVYCNLESSMCLCILWECCCYSPLSSQTRSIFNKIPYRVSSNLSSRIFKM